MQSNFYTMKLFNYLLLGLTLALCACNTRTRVPSYIIGVSQCNDDAWRRKMNQELEYEQILHPEVELRFRQAEANSAIQCQQIDSFIAEDVDLLVVCPNEADEVEPAVKRAFAAGIPVILADRNISGEDYTAFIGGDNRQVGLVLARSLQQMAAAKGSELRVLEITGLHSSTPCVLRHQGLKESLGCDSSVRIVALASGMWFEEPAERVADSLLAIYPDIDVIVAQNDLMARGAAKACARHNRDIAILGVDGMTGDYGGVEAIREGIIACSATYPSRGDLVLQRALQILNGESFPRVTILPSVLVGPDEAEPMALMAEERETEVEAISALRNKLFLLHSEFHMQRILLLLLGLLVLILIVVSVAFWQWVLYRARVEKERAEKERLLNKQRMQLQAMSEQLERSRRAVPTLQEVEQKFVDDLSREIEKRMSDTDLSVESLAEALGMSRSVLFRKVKNATGQSPVELIRVLRLNRAQKLLESGSMTVQQVAYEVGFSSPGYFARCYKEKFGVSPGDGKNRS